MSPIVLLSIEPPPSLSPLHQASFIEYLETGSCPRATNLNHETIFCMVRERILNGVATNKYTCRLYVDAG
jgi:hypothetical protein